VWQRLGHTWTRPGSSSGRRKTRSSCPTTPPPWATPCTLESPPPTPSRLRAGGPYGEGRHSQAAAHLESAGGEGKSAARHLRRLLPLKTRAEYDPAPMRATDAKAAVQAAERIVDLAAQVIASTAPDREGGGKRPSA
jgi:hypothetical protein